MSRNWNLPLPRALTRDLPRLGPIVAAFALIQVVALLAYLAATTLFLRCCTAKYLPWTFLAGYVLAAALSALFRRLSRVAPFVLLAVYFAAHAGLLGLAAAVGPAGGFSANLAILSCIVPFPILAWMLFWNVLEGRLVLKEVKAWTPLVMAAGFLAQVVTGLATGPLSSALGIEKLHALAALLLGLSVAVCWLVARRPLVGSGSERTGGSPEDEPPPEDEEPQPIVTTLIRLVFCFAVFKYLVDYQLNQAVAARYTSTTQVAGFLGQFDSLTKALLFLVQSGLAGRVLAAFPPGTVLAAMPICLSLTAAAVLTGAHFPLILAANLLFTVFDKGLNRPCLNLLLAPMPAVAARTARLRLDGQVYGSGVIAVSIGMIALPALLAPRVAFAIVACLGIGATFWCFRVNGQYVQLLERSLLRGDAAERDSALARLRSLGRARKRRILGEMLANADPLRRRVAARELARAGALPGMIDLLRSALSQETDPETQADLVSAMAAAGGQAHDLESCLRSPDARVRANAVEALLRAPAFDEAILTRRLSDTSPRVRAIAAAGLVDRSADRQTLRAGLQSLHWMLAGFEPRQRAAACWALSQVGHQAFVPALSAALEDSSSLVRRQAALGLERVWSPAALPALRKAAASAINSELRPVLDRAIRRLADRTQTEVLWAMGHLSREERQALSVNLSSLGHDAASLLARTLRFEDPRYRFRMGHAVREAHSAETRAALEDAIRTAPDGSTQITLQPLLDALMQPGAPADLWRVLGRLASAEHVGELWKHCREGGRELAAALVREPGPGARPRSFSVQPLRRQAWVLARLLSLAAGDRSVVLAALELWRRRDRRATSLSAELLEKLVTEPWLRRAVVSLAGAASDPEALRAAARELVREA